MNDQLRSLRSWLLALSLPMAACSGASTPPSTPAPVDPTATPTGSAHVSDGAPASPEKRVVSLIAGASPGSNTHRWGERSFELRRDGARTMLRIHDTVHFQGVGMTPEAMPPTTHGCSAWRELDAATAAQVAPELASSGDEAQSCDTRRATCDALRGYLGSVAAPRADGSAGPTPWLQPSEGVGEHGSCD